MYYYTWKFYYIEFFLKKDIIILSFQNRRYLLYKFYIMLETIKRIIELSRKRIDYLRKDDENWYEGAKTHYQWLLDEIEEARVEMKENNNIYLEDELWDVFWDYICLLHGFEAEWKIDMEKVFQRCLGKLSERLTTEWANNNWNEVKKVQKLKLAKEHKERFWNL